MRIRVATVRAHTRPSLATAGPAITYDEVFVEGATKNQTVSRREAQTRNTERPRYDSPWKEFIASEIKFRVISDPKTFSVCGAPATAVLGCLAEPATHLPWTGSGATHRMGR